MFEGCLVALVTPFRSGALDLPALDRLCRTLIDAGVSGLVPCGTTGESPTLSDDEQSAVIAATVRAAAGRVPVIAGAGTNSTDHTLHRAHAALAAGANAVMLVNPYYSRPTQSGLFQHFSRCARDIACPILLYNIPGRTAVELAVDTIARLRAEHANIAAVKHATGSLDSASELSLASDIVILSGDDSLTLPLMSIGARGVVSVVANLLPAETVALVAAALAGRWADARAAHRRLFPIVRALFVETNPIPIKTALALRGQVAEEFRLPMCPISPANRRTLEAALQPFFAGAAR
ncbi:MAG: 4-hydroxy-tetrahydrodipicolinate synthase [Phycisphaerae bacterium]